MRDTLAPLLPRTGEKRPKGHRQTPEIGTVHGAPAPAHARTPPGIEPPRVEFQRLEPTALKFSNRWKILARDALPWPEYAYRRIIVFTNGCFDLLHAGHVAALEAARELGDVLVVGLNSDASVRANKGDTRPILPQAERAAMLAALACVDAVVIFDEPTPENLIRELSPDVLVKGSEYADQPIAGADHVRATGGRVVLIDRQPGTRSTSEIIARCASANSRPFASIGGAP